MARLRVVVAAACMAGLFTGPAHAAEVRVAVASHFQGPMQKIAAAFAADTGHTASLSFGATGKLYVQIKNGAPYQLLLAGDAETPARLEREGWTVAGTRFTYATGRLVLWSRDAGRVDAQGEVLRSGRFEHLALADPKRAPYGAAAMEVLKQLGLDTTLAPRLVYGSNVAQAHQFVVTGAAELGFVALSQVMQEGSVPQGSMWAVPAALHAPLRHDAVLLNAGRDSVAAQALLAWLRSDRALPLLRAHGYLR